MNQWVFRVASAVRVGAGHMMRSMVLARALSQYFPVHFVLDDDGTHWGKQLSAAGFSYCTNSQFQGNALTGCLLDGYHFTQKDFLRWRERSPFIAVIADGECPLTQADMVIATAAQSSAHKNLIGYQYALIDPRFAHHDKTIHHPVKRLLINFGYIDSKNMTALALSALEQTDMHHDIHTTVLMSRHAKHLNTNQKKINALPSNVELLLDCDNVVEQVQASDLIIGAAGISLLERMAAGIPSITVQTAENQAPNYHYAVNGAATIAAGLADELNVITLSKQLATLLTDAPQRRQLSANAKRLIDGGGAKRVATALNSINKVH